MNNMILHKLNLVYNNLQDEESKIIFNAKLHTDITEPSIDSASAIVNSIIFFLSSYY